MTQEWARGSRVGDGDPIEVTVKVAGRTETTWVNAFLDNVRGSTEDDFEYDIMLEPDAVEELLMFWAAGDQGNRTWEPTDEHGYVVAQYTVEDGVSLQFWYDDEDQYRLTDVPFDLATELSWVRA
jgi:hypothetical protein